MSENDKPERRRKGYAWWQWILGLLVLPFLILVVIGILVAETDENEQVSTPHPAMTVQVALSPTAQPPTATVATPAFSPQSLELLAVYNELLTFKNEPWFHFYCYAISSPAAGWAEYVEEMRGDQYRNVSSETGVLPGEIRQMGFDYCKSQGNETDLTVQFKKNMKKDWLEYRPVPTPRPEFKVAPDRPYQAVSRKLAECIWNTPEMQGDFQDSLDIASDVSELTVLVEATIELGEATIDDAIGALTLCEFIGQ